MGRRSSRPNALPHLRARTKRGRTWYYYDHGVQPDGSRPETALGSDYLVAVQKWAELERTDAPATTVRTLLEAWQRSAYPRLSPKTIREYQASVGRLVAWFGRGFDCPLGDVESGHVGAYLRDQGNNVQATRDKAVLSAAWNWARQTGLTSLSNPCTGVKGRKSRDKRYVTDAEYQAVWNAGDWVLRDALDLLYLTGANPADALRWRTTTEALEYRRGKTDEPIRVRIIGRLKEVLDGIAERKKQEARISPYLLLNEKGERLTYAMLRNRFDEARKASNQSWQIRQLRAKAATDKTEREGIWAARDLLGHASVTTTEGYVRGRRGKLTDPTR